MFSLAQVNALEHYSQDQEQERFLRLLRESTAQNDIQLSSKCWLMEQSNVPMESLQVSIEQQMGDGRWGQADPNDNVHWKELW